MGASAGGVEALLRIAPGMAGLAAPVLLVLHIGAHRSYLPELLNARGAARAAFAEPGTVPRPGMIYVAPPDQHLLIGGGKLQLIKGPKEHHARPAIDPLFRSAALDSGARAIGVVLTGMLDDGAAGLYAIKACGGVAVVQNPETAAEPSMPASALAAVEVDHVTELDALPGLLNRLALTPVTAVSPEAPDWLRTEHVITLGKMKMQDLATIGNPSGFTCPDCGGALYEIAKGMPLRFLCHTGHAFSLRSLASTHDEVADEALWSGLRALHEKEAILRRIAAVQASESPAAHAALAEADGLRKVMDTLRDLITEPPALTPNK